MAASLARASCGGAGSAGAGHPGPVSGRRLHIVTTTTQLTDFARVLSGDRAQIYDIVKANVDPHDYEPTPADLEAVRTADLIVKNGVDLERWLDRTLESAGSNARVVDASAGIVSAAGTAYLARANPGGGDGRHPLRGQWPQPIPRVCGPSSRRRHSPQDAQTIARDANVKVVAGADALYGHSWGRPAATATPMRR